ncbi:MAG TPA: CRISPR system precrRNA processing endoribonuclease RAMP protein Cas6 [Candidatus Cloacimonetes bacterium]|nr:CRISPR system precrRNA processing endoribonuclease RAMP protein Cas6 [Candidatus Cloacimonadota bacterium]HEX38006.1 CRISPR system precrRNA processing endoribonuclease RAMP protein Cas6 [Candidatus Cloacimonadota bacterium]
MKYIGIKVTIALNALKIDNWNYSSAIRGIFGRSLKQIYCIQRNITCKECSFTDCLYFELFEKKYGDHQRYHPYIIEDITPSQNTNGLLISFTFIGKVCDQISQLLHGLLRMQRYTLIAARESYKLMIIEIHDVAGKVLYDQKTGKIETPKIHEASIEKRPVNKLKLNIITPIRVKYRNRFLTTFIWHPFLQTLYSRLKYLNQYFCSSSLKLHLLETDCDVNVVEDKTFWKEQFRKSHIQKQKMSFGGLVGEVILENINKDTFALIKLGEIFHVGKQTTFGLGKYKIEIME